MIRFEGQEFPDWDPDNAGIDEWRQIKVKLKLTIRGVIEGIRDLDPDALTAMYWLVMRSDGKHDGLPLSADMQFDVAGFLTAYAESKDEAEPDPTGGPGSVSPPSSSSSTTSSTVTSGIPGTTTSISSPDGADSDPTRLTGSPLPIS